MWLLISVLVVVAVTNLVGAEAGSLAVSWSTPTTNADGMPLTDLASYVVYLASSPPACPGTPTRTVTSPTAMPELGQTLTELVKGLTAGTTYFVRVTAVDSAGNESACSASASALTTLALLVGPCASPARAEAWRIAARDGRLTVKVEAMRAD
jgi:hypothetical protein